MITLYLWHWCTYIGEVVYLEFCIWGGGAKVWQEEGEMAPPASPLKCTPEEAWQCIYVERDPYPLGTTPTPPVAVDKEATPDSYVSKTNLFNSPPSPKLATNYFAPNNKLCHECWKARGTYIGTMGSSTGEPDISHNIPPIVMAIWQYDTMFAVICWISRKASSMFAASAGAVEPPPIPPSP